jgi:hypothetical protein
VAYANTLSPSPLWFRAYLLFPSPLDALLTSAGPHCTVFSHRPRRPPETMGVNRHSWDSARLQCSV